MSIEELEFKEQKLRHCFKEWLECINVEGVNDLKTVKCVKTYGALWHYTHQLLLAERESHEPARTMTSGTMDMKATGLKVTGS